MDAVAAALLGEDAGAPDRAAGDPQRSDTSFRPVVRFTAGPGRTVTLAGFLLGTVSGSGVATTVTR